VVSGWPIDLPAPDPDLTGTLVDRHRAVSSPLLAGGNVVLVTRLDDSVDTDGNGAADQVLSREIVIALDPASGQTAWSRPLGRTVAVASSLVPTVSMLDTAGNDLNDVTVAGPALASPVLANGRLITASFSGVVEGRLSGVNHPPAAP